MTRTSIQRAVVTSKLGFLQEMLARIATLPLASQDIFLSKPHMVAAGEFYLRRSLEALLDLGRHVLAKGFAVAAVESKEVPRKLLELGVLDAEQSIPMIQMAGYRNRMAHDYNEIGPEELYGILSGA